MWDLVTGMLASGLIGGLALALVLFSLRRGGVPRLTSPDPAGLPGSSDVINVARIRVAGIGGLGLVAMALAVAIGVPRIGRTLAVGLAAGVLLAAILIVRRRARGPLPSSGRGIGANTVLAIDGTGPAADAPERDVQDPRLHRVFGHRAPAAPPA